MTDPRSASRAAGTAPRFRWARRLATRLLLSVAAFVLAVLCAEAAYRCYLYGWRGLSPHAVSSVIELGVSGLIRASESPHVRYELEPDMDTTFKMTSFRTNACGLRDDPVETTKPPGTVRVAVIGDSFTMGSGVAQAELYHSLLERRLSTDSVRFEFLNFGVGGYGLRDYWGLMRQRVFEFDPDLILLGLVQNDRTPVGPNKPIYAKKPEERGYWRLLLWERAAELWRVRTLRELETRRQEADGGWDPTLSAGAAQSISAVQIEYVSKCLRGIQAISQERGVPVLVAHLTTRCAEGGSEIERTFRAECQAAGLPYVDTGPAFRDVRDEVHIFPNDAHPNGLAHEIYADVIERELRASQLLPGL